MAQLLQDQIFMRGVRENPSVLFNNYGDKTSVRQVPSYQNTDYKKSTQAQSRVFHFKSNYFICSHMRIKMMMNLEVQLQRLQYFPHLVQAVIKSLVKMKINIQVCF